MTVSALVARLRDLVESEYPSVWVAGEMTGLVRHSSGHWYFSLKDSAALLRAAMFRSSNLRVKFTPANGMEVLARGRISVYGVKGDLQLVVEELQPKGIGAAELALQQLKEKLFVLGYFDPRRKKPLPQYPRRIGLVSSPTGAAIRDMIELFSQRWPNAELILSPTRVQGDGAAEEIAAAIGLLNHAHEKCNLPLDAIVVARGGGSAEDLWSFNEEVVAIAIHESLVPVVSAVGHEIDVTIADLVADYRAETPSAAVTALTPDRRELMTCVLDLNKRLFDEVEHRLELARHRLDQLASRPAMRRPMQRIRDLEQRLDETTARLHRAAGQRAIAAGEKLSALAARLETLSPLNVLTRGYSLTHTEAGRLVRAATDVRPGDTIITRLAKDSIRSRVIDPAD